MTGLFDGSAFVTGGASGLGLATATELAGRGMKVVLADQNAEAGEQAAAELGATFAEVDVTDEKSVAAGLDAAGELGQLRVAVNCAGIGWVGRVLSKGKPMPLISFTTVIDVNLVGTVNVVRLAAERIAQAAEIEGERGVIVNTASVAAFDGQIGQLAYAASKAAIAGITLPLARDLASYLIRVVTIAPGTFDTPMLAALPEEARRSLGEQVPHPSRLGKPSEYGRLAADIVANPMLNGETIRLDGAIRMAPR